MTIWEDFSIIVLNKPVVFDGKVLAIKLPKEKLPCPQGKNMVVSGWGITWRKNFVPKHVLELQRSVPARFLMALDQKCLDVESNCPSFKHMDEYKDDIICAGNLKDSNNSACSGDSGGN